jgi:hypothetical protein
MRQFQITVLERRQKIADGFSTEPYECAWASEAIFFVETDNVEGEGLDACVQISPDGVRWIDEGTCVTLIQIDHFFLRVRHFGGWLRLTFSGSGSVEVTVRLALKE